jgi:hypothetical protein
VFDPSSWNSAFSPNIPGLQIAWDSTSLGTLKECPRKYQYTMLQAYAPRATSVHLIFGQVYHSALEAYDHARSRGESHESAQRFAVRVALEDTWDVETGTPWASDDSYKNRTTLVRSVVWYLEQFSDDTLTTVQLANGKPAVELSFKLELPDIHASDGTPFLLSGHMDRLVTFHDRVYVLDRKTTKSALSPNFFSQWTPNNQFSLYAFAAKVIFSTPAEGLIVDAAQIAVGFTRFQRGIVPRNDAQLADWYHDTLYWLGLAQRFADDQHWPQNDKSCSNYGGCAFRSICAKAPETREIWLEADFTKKVWDPLVVRGDI